MPIGLGTANSKPKNPAGWPGFWGGEFARFSWLWIAAVREAAGGEFAQTPAGQA
jgi:hypothetical protein